MRNFEEMQPAKRLLLLVEAIENSYNELASKEERGDLTERERGELESICKLMYLIGY